MKKYYTKELPVDEKNQEVNGLEIRDRRVESTKQTPGKGYEPIASVVDLTSRSPPTASKQLRASLGLHVFEMHHLNSKVKPFKEFLIGDDRPAVTYLRRIWILAEGIFLGVGRTEDIIS